ncbi:hypothetical protein [Vibrio rotiferianus]|uniref:Cytochrome P460 domain-containing protein n=1 Tax=Vibrio rotiferianus TaxID=190895 RepID=A0ABX3DDY6_9VIBR|nr:hypothetical protein [Vibrio rotiferianus]OHY95690.1 hypothetical protein BI375_13080 [Vibrio rotiferianus]TMX72573.1 hypothetical protein DA097_02625 [Vibrio rotiferianus]
MRHVLYSMLLVSSSVYASSMASFPNNWEDYVLVKRSIIPASDVVLPPETPTFIQQTVKTYNWTNGGKGTNLSIYVPQKKLEAYKAHGPYTDGITAVAVYEESNIIFVTEHLAGETLYGSFDREGNDISAQHPSLNIEACYRCHNGYEDICINGTCSVPIIDVFNK